MPLCRLSRRDACLLLLGAAPALAAGARAASAPLTLYSAQHEQMVDVLTAAFTKATGIPVRVRSGEPPAIASQILREGASSPADVYFTENSPELMLLDEHGLLAPVAPATLATVPAKYSAPDGHWLGVLARENVLVYAPAKISASALPASMLDLAKPEWKGRIAIAPTDADFLPLVGAVAATVGRQGALAWLRGLRDNAQLFDDDEGVVAAVERGAVATGLINSYYWQRLRVEKGAAHMTSRIHHFGHGDVGGLLNISGAAVLKSAPHPREAQQFLAFLVSQQGQELMAHSNISFEYPLRLGVAANPAVTPMNQLQPPPLDPAQLGDDRDAANLLRDAGLI